MANVNVTPKRLAPLGGAGNDGTRVVYASAAKATQNDTVTFQNVKEIVLAYPTVTNGTNTTVDTYSITDASNQIALTGTTTGTAKILAIIK